MIDANITIICAVYDSAVGEYLMPFFQKTRAEALRSFKQACNQKDHNFSLHAGDYALFVIGEFNSETGEIKALANYDNLGKAIEHIQPSELDPLVES